MQQDLEEGELADSDDDSRTLTVSASGGSVSGAAVKQMEGTDDLARPLRNIPPASISNTSSVNCKPSGRLRRDSSDTDSSDAEPASDSDDDREPAAKHRRLPGARCPALQADQPAGVQATGGTASAAGSRSRKNNIWGSVLVEQTLSKDLGSWFGVNKTLDSDRDVETYNYLNAKNDTRTEESASAPVDEPAEPVPPAANVSAVDIGDIETFGTASCKREERAESEKEPSNNCGDDNVVDDCRKRLERKRRFNFDPASTVTAAPCRHAVPTYDKTKDRSHVRVSLTDSAEVVSEELMRLLGEPESMTDTFVRVVEELGPEKALELVYCTEDREEAGGMLTLDGSRRRTPGGVYLFLIKEDKTITKRQVKQIFRERYEFRKRTQKEARKRRLRRCVANMEVEMATNSKDDNSPAQPADGAGDRLLPEVKDCFLNGTLTKPKELSESSVTAVGSEDIEANDVGLDDETIDIELDVY